MKGSGIETFNFATFTSKFVKKTEQKFNLISWIRCLQTVIFPTYRQTSNVNRSPSLVGNTIVDHSDVVGADRQTPFSNSDNLRSGYMDK